jgi:hypothetical protein
VRGTRRARRIAPATRTVARRRPRWFLKLLWSERRSAIAMPSAVLELPAPDLWRAAAVLPALAPARAAAAALCAALEYQVPSREAVALAHASARSGVAAVCAALEPPDLSTAVGARPAHASAAAALCAALERLVLDRLTAVAVLGGLFVQQKYPRIALLLSHPEAMGCHRGCVRPYCGRAQRKRVVQRSPRRRTQSPL